MTVKNIHFISCVPGLPVYELSDGTLRLPFYHQKSKELFYCSESEIVKGLSNVEHIIEARQPFLHAKKEIETNRLTLVN